MCFDIGVRGDGGDAYLALEPEGTVLDSVEELFKLFGASCTNLISFLLGISAFRCAISVISCHPIFFLDLCYAVYAV